MKTESDESSATIRYHGKDWQFATSSGLAQGSTNELRKEGKRAHTLSAMGRMLYIYLLSYVSPDSAQPFPSMKRICGDLYLHAHTVQKYRRELEKAGMLRREQQTLPGSKSKKENGPGAWRHNVYTLYSWTAPYTPASHEKVVAKKVAPKISVPKKLALKNSQSLKELPKSRSSSNGAAAPDPAATAQSFDPSDHGAAAPDPASSLTQQFIDQWKKCYPRLHQGTTATVITREKTNLIEFFRDNLSRSVNDLATTALAAWMMPGDADKNGRNPYWHCNIKSHRILSFLKYLPEIEDELQWNGTEQQRARVLKTLERDFPVVNVENADATRTTSSAAHGGER